MKLKVISVILTVIMIFTSISMLGIVSVNGATIGDVNGDGIVNSKDSLILRKFIADYDVTIDNVAADANSDGSINSKDTLYIRQIIAEIIIIEPTQTTTVLGQTTSGLVEVETKVNFTQFLEARYWWDNYVPSRIYGKDGSIKLSQSDDILRNQYQVAYYIDSNMAKKAVDTSLSATGDDYAKLYIDVTNIACQNSSGDSSAEIYMIIAGKNTSNEAVQMTSLASINAGQTKTMIFDSSAAKDCTWTSITIQMQNYANKIKNISFNFSPIYARKIELQNPTSTQQTTAVTTGTEDNTKLIALTFDDGPNAYSTPLILNKLKKYSVKATFFYIGLNINSSVQDVINTQVQMGCEIGNHSYNHNNMGSMTPDQIKSEIKRTQDLILQYAGVQAKYFRPPFLAVNSTMYSNIDLTFIAGICPNDWNSSVTVQNCYDSLVSSVTDGTIILLHDSQSKNAELMDLLIPYYQNQGYEFVTLSELFRRKGVEPQGFATYSKVG